MLSIFIKTISHLYSVNERAKEKTLAWFSIENQTQKSIFNSMLLLFRWAHLVPHIIRIYFEIYTKITVIAFLKLHMRNQTVPLCMYALFKTDLLPLIAAIPLARKFTTARLCHYVPLWSFRHLSYYRKKAEATTTNTKNNLKTFFGWF